MRFRVAWPALAADLVDFARVSPEFRRVALRGVEEIWPNA